MSFKPRPERRRIELDLRAGLLAAAEEYSVDIQAAAEEGIKAAVKRRWLEENREAIEENNRWVEKNGLPFAKYHAF
jgi:antitoxin CcdA